MIKIYHLNFFFSTEKKKAKQKCRIAEGGGTKTHIGAQLHPALLTGQSSHSWIRQNLHLQSWEVCDHCGVSGLAFLL